MRSDELYLRDIVEAVVGFRNFAVHAYFSISFPIVWVTATKDAPALRKHVSEILAQEYDCATDESE